ncbi:hypothetical protein VTG60DRAFT_865 [Thermothelomyces hinnuleus]
MGARLGDHFSALKVNERGLREERAQQQVEHSEIAPFLRIRSFCLLGEREKTNQKRSFQSRRHRPPCELTLF